MVRVMVRGGEGNQPKETNPNQNPTTFASQQGQAVFYDKYCQPVNILPEIDPN
jgi:hypothetical protein